MDMTNKSTVTARTQRQVVHQVPCFQANIPKVTLRDVCQELCDILQDTDDTLVTEPNDQTEENATSTPKPSECESDAFMAGIRQFVENCKATSNLLELNCKLSQMEMSNTIADILDPQLLEQTIKQLNAFSSVLDTICDNESLVLSKLRQAARFDGEVIKSEQHKYITDTLVLLKTLPEKIDSALQTVNFLTENVTIDKLKELCGSRFSAVELVEIVKLMCAHRRLIIALQKMAINQLQ